MQLVDFLKRQHPCISGCGLKLCSRLDGASLHAACSEIGIRRYGEMQPIGACLAVVYLNDLQQ